MRLRVWAEFMTPAEICAPAVKVLLARYAVQPCLAVPYGSLGAGYARYLREYGEAGLEPALWPTLTDDLGYWPHEGNTLEFSAYVHELFHWAESQGVSIPWLAVDLETPYYQGETVRQAKVEKGNGGLKAIPVQPEPGPVQRVCRDLCPVQDF